MACERIFDVNRTLAISTIIPQSTKPKVKLLPLHLTSFEYYMLVDDRPNYPMTFTVQLELSGRLDVEHFEASIHCALERHPLLQAIIGPGKQGKDCWIKPNNPVPLISFGDLTEPIEFPTDEYLDIRKEVGLRMFVRYNEDQAIVSAQFHHCACDGIGSYQFLGDVLFEYSKRTTEMELPQQTALDPRRLRSRGKASYDINNFRLPNGKYQRTWDEALTHVLRPNIVLNSTSKKSDSFSRPFPGIRSYTFDKAEYKKLRLAAQSRGQIINDMLLEELFETLHQWNRKYNRFTTRRNVSVMMPLNLREQQDKDIPACNVVAHAFVRRSKRAVANKAKFRLELANELLKVKHERHKIRFMHMIAGGHYFYPRTFQTALNWKRNLATAILSNTGDPTKQFYTQLPREKGVVRCGNLMLEDISGVPPLRPGTNATISVFTYRRELKICLRCDPNQFSEQDSQSVLDLYIQQIRTAMHVD